MGPNAKHMTPAAAVLMLLAVAACQSMPGNGDTGSQPATGQPSIAPSPSPTLLASGTFRFPPLDAAVVLDATGAGSHVTGTMTVSNDEMSFTVDLECAVTVEDGRILIGGDTTDSTFDYAPAGTRTAIVLKPGSPVRGIFCLAIYGPRSGQLPGVSRGHEPRDDRARAHRRDRRAWFVASNGAPDRTRTCDLWVRNPTLYPLSYRRASIEGYRATDED